MVKNSLYNFLGGVVKVACITLTTPILIRLMGVEDYGIWAIVSSIVGLAVLAEAGLSTATTTFVSEDLDRGDDESLSTTLTTTLITVLFLSGFASLLLLFVSQSIAPLFPKLHPEQQVTLYTSLQIASISIFFQLLQQSILGVEQAYKNYALMNSVVTGQWFLLCLGWCVIASINPNVIFLCIWQCVITIVSFLCHLCVIFYLLKSHLVRFSWSKERSLEIIQYCSGTWISTLGALLFTKGDRLIVGSILGASSLTIYSAISDFSSAINYFSSKPIQPILPLISTFKSFEENPGIKTALAKIFKLNAYSSTILGLLLLLSSPVLLRLTLPEGLVMESQASFHFLIFITSLYSLNSTGYFILLGLKQTKIFAQINIVSGLISIVGIYIGANSFGLKGAILGNAGFLLTLFFPVVALQKMNMNPSIIMSWIKKPLILFFLFFSLYFASTNLFFPNVQIPETIILIGILCMLYNSIQDGMRLYSRSS
jgi:O-antigen/teichoic acid export membrane protein